VSEPRQVGQPLARVRSIKVKLGLLVAVSVTVAAVVGAVGTAGGVPLWLALPVTVGLSLAVTQLLALGMTSPLRQMTEAARRMATGDYDVRVDTASSDEVGELTRAFNTMARDLATVDRQRRDLVATVSHELRTPITALCAVLENLVDGVAPSDPDYLVAPLAQAERMARLVDDLLDLAKVDAGRAPLTPEPVPVGPLLEAAVAEPRPGREVTYDVRPGPDDLVVHADPARLRQLVANLLDNAARHSPAGGTVVVSAARADDRLVLEVTDQGPGVDVADRERVFERFGTLEGGADGAPTGGGTGLGLAIARWVSDLHGGRIRFVDPDPGTTGARVRVELPLSPHVRPAARPADIPRQEKAVTPPSPVPPPAAPLPPPPPARGPNPYDPRTPAGVPMPPKPLLDDLFGSFWPDGAAPALRILLGALGVGVLGGLVLPDRDLGLGTFLVLLGAGAVVLAAAKNRRDPFTLTCAALCALLAMVTVVRDAEWISVLCLLAGAALCLVGVTRGRTVGGFLLAGISWPLAGLRGLPWLGRTIGVLVGIGHGAALLRTAVLSALGLLVFGALFASADALVAEWMDAVLPDLTVDTFVLRTFVAVFVGGTVLAAAYLALNPPRVDRDARGARPVTHRFEWLAPVAVVNLVFLAFLAAQATVVFGGHDYLERTTGVTYADYVHQGFGQLTVATVLTLLVVAVAGRKAPRETAVDRLWLRGALGLLCVQTLVVVASALYRMHVYQEAYGFTRLRLLVDVFEGWLGVVVLAVLVSGITLNAARLARFAVLSGCVALLGLAAINPDAWIAERNLDRYADTGKVDWTYLRGLSDDAVPVVLDRPLEERQCALGYRGPSGGDWLEWNLGRARAEDRLASVSLVPDVGVACPGEVRASGY
jgi:two-component system sensor histidine kinase BaeS